MVDDPRKRSRHHLSRCYHLGVNTRVSVPGCQYSRCHHLVVGTPVSSPNCHEYIYGYRSIDLLIFEDMYIIILYLYLYLLFNSIRFFSYVILLYSIFVSILGVITWLSAPPCHHSIVINIFMSIDRYIHLNIYIYMYIFI